MIPKDLLELLTELLENRLVRSPGGTSIRLEDLIKAVLELKQQEEQTTLPRALMGARITKKEAAKRTETVNRFYRVARIINSTASAAIAGLQAELAEKREPKYVYLPEKMKGLGHLSEDELSKM